MKTALIRTDNNQNKFFDVFIRFDNKSLEIISENNSIILDRLQIEQLFDEIKNWIDETQSINGWSDYWSLATK